MVSPAAAPASRMDLMCRPLVSISALSRDVDYLLLQSLPESEGPKRFLVAANPLPQTIKILQIHPDAGVLALFDERRGEQEGPKCAIVLVTGNVSVSTGAESNAMASRMAWWVSWPSDM